MIVREVRKALVFEKANLDVVELSRTLPGRRRWKDGALYVETTADNLAVVLERLPWIRSKNLGCISRYRDHLAEREFVREARRNPPPEAGSFPFKTEPFAHQLKAFSISRRLEYFGLFMEMGTGKTKILIDTAFGLFSEGAIDTVVVIAPNGVHRQWIEEQIPTHAPEHLNWAGIAWRSGMTKKEYHGWHELRSSKGDLRWFTFAAESLSGSKRARDEVESLAMNSRSLGIIDESHMFKSPSSQRTKFLLKLSRHFKYRRIATGTEVTQGLQDLYTQLTYLSPSILGLNNFTSFRARYCITRPIPGAPAGAVEIVGYQNQRELAEKIADWTFQAKKAECLDLPPKTYENRPVELTAEQRRVYQTLKDDLLAQISDGTLVEVQDALPQLAKMQQVLSGFLIDDEGVPHEIDTLRPAALLDLLPSARRGIIWARFRYDIKRLYRDVTAAGWRAATYYGSTSTDDRTAAVQGLRDGSIDWLIANPASAGTGLNLQAVNTAIYYTNGFDAAQRWQSEDRIHRPGQEWPCTYIDLYSPGTLDTKVLAALRKKKAVADDLRDLRKLFE